ncbi:MAG: NAD-dependent protein deacylase, partial [Verrucomicrobiaceae bacterium]|nr:NAD-dependent protein deacylase [Verrucomicrobiaceae bacterium]
MSARFSRIVILTGAGVSAESGVPTFRASDGLWENHRIEDVASPEGFARDPALVQHFYNLRRAALKTVQPNPAHLAIARLQREFDGEVTLITQNVDDLHERGGSPEVLHMHGELLSALCLQCGQRSSWDGGLGADSICRKCRHDGTL